MIHHTLVHCSSSELVTHSPIKPHLTSASKPTSFVIGGHGRTLTTTGWLIVEHGSKFYQIEKL